MDNDDLIAWLEAELETRGWSARELARRAGLSEKAISNVLTRRKLAGWDLCTAIAAPLGISPVEVLVRSGKLSPSAVRAALPFVMGSDASTTAQITAIAHSLNDESKDTLLRVAKALAK